MNLARYDEAIHAIYDATLRPEGWQNAVSMIANAFDVPRVLLFTYTRSPNEGGFLFTHNISQAALEQWAAKNMHEDPFLRAAQEKGLLAEGNAGIDSDLVSRQELVVTPFYRELWEPMDIGRMCTGVVFDATDTHKLSTMLSMYRSFNDPPFSREDADAAGRILRHLSRALGVMFHLRDSQLQLAASLTALDRLQAGVVLLDGAGQVSFLNGKAQSLVADGKVIRLAKRTPDGLNELGLDDRLRSFEPELQRRIRDALEPMAMDPEHFSEALLLPDSSDLPGFVVHIAPLPNSNGFLVGDAVPKAIAFIYDLRSVASVPTHRLVELFGLTEAEARAAGHVAAGGSIEDMAGRIGVTANTLKTQLKAVYAKTGALRQVDLLKLLLGLASR